MTPGLAWERALEAQHDRYMLEGRAIVIRTPPPYRNGRAVRKGPLDYVALLPGGRTIVLDAKDYRDGFCLSDIPDHQAGAMANAGRLGHRGGLLLRTDTGGELAWWADIAADWWAWRNAGGANGPVYGVAFVGTDWLSVLEEG